MNVAQTVRHGDGDDARLHAQPRQRDLEDGGVMGFGDGFQFGIGLQFALVERRVGREQDVVFLAIFQHTAFHVGAVAQAVGNLIGDDRRLGQFLRLFELAQIEVAHAQMLHQFVAHELIHGAEGVFEIHARRRPVDEVQVNVIGTEVVQAVLAGLDERAIRQMARADLRCDENVLAPHISLAQGSSDQLLRMAFGVILGCVEMGIAHRQRGVERGQRAVVPLGAGLGVAANFPRAVADFGEGYVVYGFCFHVKPPCLVDPFLFCSIEILPLSWVLNFMRPILQDIWENQLLLIGFSSLPMVIYLFSCSLAGKGGSLLAKRVSFLLKLESLLA